METFNIFDNGVVSITQEIATLIANRESDQPMVLASKSQVHDVMLTHYMKKVAEKNGVTVYAVGYCRAGILELTITVKYCVAVKDSKVVNYPNLGRLLPKELLEAL